MPRDRNSDLKNPSDQQWIKSKMKEIKRAKKAGNKRKAQRLSNELLNFLGWE